MAKQLRVAEVLSQSAIVINAGQDEKIENGHEFVVYERGPEVVDPETKESLGHLDIKKGRFVAVDVQPNLTIARLQRHTVTKARRRPDPLNSLRRMLYEDVEVEAGGPVRMDVSVPTYKDALVIRKNDLVRRIKN